MRKRRKAVVIPKSDGWRCCACKAQTSVIALEVRPSGNMGMALCIPCVRHSAMLLPGEGGLKP